METHKTKIVCNFCKCKRCNECKELINEQENITIINYSGYEFNKKNYTVKEINYVIKSNKGDIYYGQ